MIATQMTLKFNSQLGGKNNKIYETQNQDLPFSNFMIIVMWEKLTESVQNVLPIHYTL